MGAGKQANTVEKYPSNVRGIVIDKSLWVGAELAAAILVDDDSLLGRSHLVLAGAQLSTGLDGTSFFLEMLKSQSFITSTPYLQATPTGPSSSLCLPRLL